MKGEAELPTLPMTDSDADAGGATYGRFVSLGVIGRGGMGVVLRARDPQLDRNVAIKLLGAAWGADPGSTERLEREARAMAKLSHPNVVMVFEMGQVGAERFIAMELVEGTTLRKWLGEPRPWRETLAAFVHCGRGLAAAHAAGLVHRDFKPENVLIGADGRPRVSDFGLVAHGVAIAKGDAGDASPVSPLTVRGSVMGTPAYMAPEQWDGGEVDARTDQFAFCVSLWEALYGERPFAGAITGELREHILAGDVRGPPRDARAPRWIEPILRRGLARDRAARWPDMTALLAQLDRPARRRWPWLLAGGGVIATVAAVAIVVAGTAAADPCPDPVSRLAGTWDDAIRGRITAAFTAANPAVAADAIARVAPALDRYAGAWREASRAACRATRVDGTQSAELLDRRMLCLERRRTELATLTGVLATADRARVASAVDAAGALGELDQCADQERLLALAPPTDPALRQRAEALDVEINATTALQYANRPPERQARATAALATARELGTLPQLVHALQEVSGAATENADDALRESSLRELAQRAAEAHDDRLAASAWIDLIRLLARLHKVDEAKALEPVASAAVTRAGSPPKLRYRLASTLARRLMYSGDLAGALEGFRAALDLATTDVERATTKLELAQVTFQKDGAAAALPLAEEGTKATETAYGPNHPRTADGLYLVGQFLIEADELDRAQQIIERVLAIREAAHGKEHHDVATTLHLLGTVAKQRGDTKTARGYFERAIANFDARGESDEAGLSRGTLAAIIADEDGLAAARPYFVEALAGLTRAGQGQNQYLSVEINYARRLVDAHLCDEAAPLLAHVAEAWAPTPRRLPFVLLLEAECAMAAKQPADAIAALERAHTICAEGGCQPQLVLEVGWQFGKALVETRRDRARGMKLVDEVVAGAGKFDAELVAEIATWRKQH